MDSVLEELPKLTDRQAQALVYILDFFSENRHAPTHREINRAMGTAATTAAPFVEPLVKKGYLVRNDGVRRNIKPTRRAQEWMQWRRREATQQLNLQI